MANMHTLYCTLCIIILFYRFRLVAHQEIDFNDLIQLPKRNNKDKDKDKSTNSNTNSNSNEDEKSKGHANGNGNGNGIGSKLNIPLFSRDEQNRYQKNNVAVIALLERIGETSNSNQNRICVVTGHLYW